MSSLVYEGRHLTATEMERRGLVDAVLWPSSFHEDLMSRVQQLATQATQVLFFVFFYFVVPGLALSPLLSHQPRKCWYFRKLEIDDVTVTWVIFRDWVIV